jgi:hypothetical protein
MEELPQTHPAPNRTHIRAILPSLPLWLRTINMLGAQCSKLGVGTNLLALHSILNQAKRQTGLSDWGDESFLVPLKLLTEPDGEGLKITLVGKIYLRQNLVDGVVNRLLIQEEIRHHPEILEQKIERPLFIAGMPRTGSTLLQRLLSQDPHCRPLLCWEALHPAPAPSPATHTTDPRIRRVERELSFLYKIFPELPSMHYMDASTPEECEWLLNNSFIIPGFAWEFPEFPTYNSWCRGQDRTPAYRYYKIQLQILQKNFIPAHWVLKANEHVNSLDSLLTVFPDACIVQTHRDPVNAVASHLSFYIRLAGLKFDLTEAYLARAAQEMLETYAAILDRAMLIREQSKPEQFFDVRYEELMQDPLGVVCRIYDHFGYPLTAECKTRASLWMKQNPQGKHGIHRYTLEQFGLTREQVYRRFAQYYEYFQIEPR